MLWVAFVQKDLGIESVFVSLDHFIDHLAMKAGKQIDILFLVLPVSHIEIISWLFWDWEKR